MLIPPTRLGEDPKLRIALGFLIDNIPNVPALKYLLDASDRAVLICCSSFSSEKNDVLRDALLSVVNVWKIFSLKRICKIDS